MGTLNDLQTPVRLLEEFELPVSPILQYAIKVKMESLHGGQDTIEYDSTVELKCEAFHKNPPTTLRVEFPDGTVISELKAADALKQTIAIDDFSKTDSIESFITAMELIKKYKGR